MSHLSKKVKWAQGTEVIPLETSPIAFSVIFHTNKIWATMILHLSGQGMHIDLEALLIFCKYFMITFLPPARMKRSGWSKKK